MNGETKLKVKSLAGKKILFICPHFFGYERMLSEEMRQLGAEVFYFDERLSNNNFSKMLVRANKRLIENKIEKYYDQILKKIEDIDFDFLFICRAETITENFLKKFSTAQKKCHRILYLWDSIKDNANGYKKRFYFDEVITFDHNDSLKYSISLRPLFFHDSYLSIPKRESFLYDAMFIGTAHNDRYTILEKLKSDPKICSFYFYYYLQSPIMLTYYKFIKKSYPVRAKKEDFNFNSLSLEDILKIMDKSRAVIDIQKKNQSGLTMRSIEVLGAGRKLITTNQDIKNYDFYDENNIAILNRENPQIPVDFLSKDYNEIDKEILEKYTISFFINEIFGKVKKEEYYYYK